MSSGSESTILSLLVNTIKKDPALTRALAEHIEKYNKETVWPIPQTAKTVTITYDDLFLYPGTLIKRYSTDNPFTECFFKLVLDNKDEHSDFCSDLSDLPYVDNSDDSCIAGSSIVQLLALHANDVKESVVDGFRDINSDVDIFKLLQSKIDITKIWLPTTSSKLDIVSTKYKSVEDLLMGFDLPCCRAAATIEGGTRCLYVSLQCLRSLVKGEMVLPSYMKDVNSENMIDQELRMVFTRFNSRVKKYAKRGIQCLYAETSDQWPWFSKGFTYQDSVLTKMDIKKTDKGFKLILNDSLYQ